MTGDRLAAKKVAFHAATQRIVEVLFLKIQKLLVVRRHGSIDEDVDAAEGIHHVADHRVNLWSFAQIDGVLCGFFSYEDIRSTAMDLKISEEFKDNKALQKMDFSDRYCKSLLLRWKLQRRRVTSILKKRPPVTEVEQRLAALRAKLAKYPLELILSSDETAIMFRAPFKYQYVEKDAARATGFIGSDEKERFTAILAASAAGITIPGAFILKCSTGANDQSKVKVIDAVLQCLGGEAAGWKVQHWTVRNLPLGKDGAVIDVMRKVLIHSDGSVVWVQKKGWNDAIGMCMYGDLVLAPIARKAGHDLAVVMDNCSSHCPAVVAAYLKQNCRTELLFLPPNMTDRLQVMDLVINGPMKAALRRERARQMRPQIDAFRSRLLSNKSAEFVPDLPSRHDGVTSCIAAIKRFNDSATIRNSIVKCFQDIGLVPFGQYSDGKAKYCHYTSHTEKIRAMPDVESGQDALSRSSMLARVDVCSREDDVVGSQGASLQTCEELCEADDGDSDAQLFDRDSDSADESDPEPK